MISHCVLGCRGGLDSPNARSQHSERAAGTIILRRKGSDQRPAFIYV
jgi:hypothetical protein